MIILYAKNNDVCINYDYSGSVSAMTLRVDNKIIKLAVMSGKYILINDKYKAYYKGTVHDGLCGDSPTMVYQNKSYRYGFCDEDDRSLVNIRNIYGLNRTIVYYES